jgi:hypothetical protein
MKWILFTGTWRVTNQEVERDVRSAAREVIARGDGVLSGGATGVDFFALDEAMKLNLDFSQIKIIIPALLEDYIHDMYTNWCIPPINKNDITLATDLLRAIKKVRPESLVEMPYHTITQEHYDLRNIEEVDVADEVYAFQVNESTGTEHTVNEAKRAGVPVAVHKKYLINE